MSQAVEVCLRVFRSDEQDQFAPVGLIKVSNDATLTTARALCQHQQRNYMANGDTIVLPVQPRIAQYSTASDACPISRVDESTILVKEYLRLLSEAGKSNSIYIRRPNTTRWDYD